MHTHIYICIHIYIYTCVCLYMCMCVRAHLAIHIVNTSYMPYMASKYI